MKRITFISICLAFVSLQVSAQHSEKISKVLEYKPAPGQHINRLFPTPAFSNTADSALLFASQKLTGNLSMVGLGAFGGYAVVGFDHSIVKVAGEYDFKALGNSYTGSSEPGIVMVSQDLNKNGLHDPDETWYELAGSDYYQPQTIHNYEITYYRPQPDKQKSNTVWKDNQGNTGVVTHISFAGQATIYPLWFANDSLVFKGTRLRSTVVNTNGVFTMPAFDWGYVDNNANSSTIDKTGFKIDWAVDENGNAVDLKYIDFIKVYTAQVQEAGWLGETSTEFAGIVDLHPQAMLRSTGIPEYEVLNAVNIYPVIFSDYLVINSNSSQPVAIYNLTGVMLLSTQLLPGNNRFETTNFPAGVYIIKTTGKVQKILKK